MTREITVPETCKECYGTDFQIEGCPYQLSREIDETVEYYRDKYHLDLREFGFDLKQILRQIKPKANECKKHIEQRARAVIREQERKENDERMKHLEEQIEKTQDMLQKMIEKQDQISIFRQEEDIDTPVKKVKKKTKKQEGNPDIKYTFHENDELPEDEPDPDELVPHGGWMKFYRNVKEENVSKYLDTKLREKHPELSDEIDKFLDGEPTDAIKITDNNSGKKMIEFRKMKKRSEIEE